MFFKRILTLSSALLLVSVMALADEDGNQRSPDSDDDGGNEPETVQFQKTPARNPKSDYTQEFMARIKAGEETTKAADSVPADAPAETPSRSFQKSFK